MPRFKVHNIASLVAYQMFCVVVACYYLFN
jgi:energy-converting hydrogenase Eha subunit C